MINPQNPPTMCTAMAEMGSSTQAALRSREAEHASSRSEGEQQPPTLIELAELRCGVLKLLHRGAMSGSRAVMQQAADMDCTPWQERPFLSNPVPRSAAEDDDADVFSD